MEDHEPLEVAGVIEVNEDDPATRTLKGDRIYVFSNGERMQIRQIPDEKYGLIQEEMGNSLVRMHPSSPDVAKMHAVMEAIERWHLRQGN